MNTNINTRNIKVTYQLHNIINARNITNTANDYQNCKEEDKINPINLKVSFNLKPTNNTMHPQGTQDVKN